ncbi:MAG: hypothetical protein ACK4FW_08625 [Stenotrophomonas sp.]|jgi:hypothetical protein
MRMLHRLTVITLTAGLFAPVLASAQNAQAAGTCCNTDPHGVAIASKGIGESAPLALDVSQVSAWKAFEFKRDGVWYLQVNDRDGNVRAIIGNIDREFWTLPGGVDADRVSLPRHLLDIPAGAQRTVVYRKPQMLLVGYNTAGGMMWSVESPDGTR